MSLAKFIQETGLSGFLTAEEALADAHRPLSTEEDRLGRESDELVSRRNGERIFTEEQAAKVVGFSARPVCS